MHCRANVVSLLPGNIALYNDSDSDLWGPSFQIVNNANSRWPVQVVSIPEDAPILTYAHACNYTPQMHLNTGLPRPFWAHYLTDTSQYIRNTRSDINKTIRQTKRYGFQPEGPAELPFREGAHSDI